MKKVYINIAEMIVGTRALGPGYRSVIWVQGCKLNCKGCTAPDWIPQVPNRIISTDELSRYLITDHKISGLTISGGEPFLQVNGLIDLIERIKKSRDIDIICFTGFKYEFLIENNQNERINHLLSLVDLLIDGPYVERLNDGKGLRGSTNQRFIYLSKRLANQNFMNLPRNIEYLVKDGQLLMIGIPPNKIDQEIESIILNRNTEVNYVRA